MHDTEFSRAALHRLTNHNQLVHHRWPIVTITRVVSRIARWRNGLARAATARRLTSLRSQAAQFLLC